MIFLSNISKMLVDEKLLWLGRTDEKGVTNSTIFQYRKNKYYVFKRFNNGFELEKEVLKFTMG